MPTNSSQAARKLANSIAVYERRYVGALRGLARSVAKVFEKELLPFLDAREDASGANPSAAIRVLGIQVRLVAEVQVGRLYDTHSKDLAAGNMRGLRVIGIHPPNDKGVKQALEKRRKENIALVVDAQRAYARSVERLFEEDQTGRSVESLKKELLSRGDIAQSRAELIARDQTLKMNGELTAIRQQNAGVESYVWNTSNDERVRDEHAVLEGQIFSWDSPPSVGHPGDDYQCRCVAIPVIPVLED